MPLLEVRQLRKSYPDGWTLHDVSFGVEQGENLCLLGPSGCGKTTLLRLIAGLETPDNGQVLVDGQDVTQAPPHLRGFGLMFQEYALFPHKDVFGNVAFGLQMQRQRRQAVAARVAEVLALVGLAGFEHRDVNQLSGGERQRVALARSLAPQPCLLMLDEPLGALDRALRERLMDELPGILRRAGATAVTVTHDQEEAFAIADRVVLIQAGRVVQVGTPEEVYRQPASAWVARFLGLTNVLAARVVEPGRVETAIGVLEVGDWGLEIGSWPVQVLIRPEAARLDGGGPNVVRGVVTERSFRGERYRLGVRHAGGVELTFHFPANVDLPAPGEPVTLSLAPSALMLLLGDGAVGDWP
jgi:ABC-type Fe3+/spermidine/putrescine transport system ATPase subunit